MAKTVAPSFFNIAFCENFLSLMVTSAQVVETSVTTTDTVLLRTVFTPDDQTILSQV